MLKKFGISLLALLLVSGMILSCGDKLDPPDPSVKLPTTATLWHRGGTYAGNGSFTGMGGSDYNEVVIVFDRQFSAMDVVVMIESTSDNVNFYLRNTFIGSEVGKGIEWTSANDYGNVTALEGRTNDQYAGGITLNPLAKKANCVVINSGAPLALTVKSITIGGNPIEIDFSTAKPTSEFVNELADDEEAPEPEPPEPEVPPEYIAVEVWGDARNAVFRDQRAEIKTLGGELTILDKEAGYKVKWTNGHGNHWTGFKVDLGDAFVYQIEKIEFELKTLALKGVDGDDNCGKITVRAMSQPQTGYTGDGAVLATVVSPHGGNINKSGVNNPAGVTLNAEKEAVIADRTNFNKVIVNLDPDTPNAKLTGEVWLGIYIHAGPDSEVEIQKINIFTDGSIIPAPVCATCGCDLNCGSDKCHPLAGCNGDCGPLCFNCDRPTVDWIAPAASLVPTMYGEAKPANVGKLGEATLNGNAWTVNFPEGSHNGGNGGDDSSSGIKFELPVKAHMYKEIKIEYTVSGTDPEGQVVFQTEEWGGAWGQGTTWEGYVTIDSTGDKVATFDASELKDTDAVVCIKVNNWDDGVHKYTIEVKKITLVAY